jgi:hypothetical protein
MDYEHIRNLLQETLLRYDDRIDWNLFKPNLEKQAEGNVDINSDFSINRMWQRAGDKRSENQQLKEEIADARSEEL